MEYYESKEYYDSKEHYDSKEQYDSLQQWIEIEETGKNSNIFKFFNKKSLMQQILKA